MAKQAKTKQAADQARLRAAFGLEAQRHQVHLLSPEGVPIQANRVPPMSRLGALALDVLIQFGAILLIMWALGSWFFWSTGAGSQIITILWFILFTFMRMPYFILMEYMMRGQTIGKRVVGIRVVDEAGGRLRLSSLIVRNMSREVEATIPGFFIMSVWIWGADGLGWGGLLLTLWVVFVFIFPFTNRDRKRLGDMLAGTVVVSVEKPKLLPDVAANKVSADFTFTAAQLAAYGEFEVQVLQRILGQNQNEEQLKSIVGAIVKKIQYRSRIPNGKNLAFLQAFYQAQRKYLEERLLVGKRKESKFATEQEM